MKNIEQLQAVLRDYKTTIIEMTNLQNRWNNNKDEETYKILNLSKYIASNLETKIIDICLIENK